MRSARIVLAVAACGLLWLAACTAPAQQVTVTTPFHAVNDSFFERIGVDFDFNIGGIDRPGMVFGRPDPNAGFGQPVGRNVMDVDGGPGVVVGLAAPGVFTPDLRIPFRQNNFGLAVPQFGGFDPGAGLTSGFQVRGRHGNASLFWTAAQGYRQSMVSQAPSVTLTNGYPGYISDTSQSPFVVGLIPIVGGIVEGFPIGPWPQYGVMGYPGYSPGPPSPPAWQRDPWVQAMWIAAQNQALDADLPLPPAVEPPPGSPAPMGAPAPRARDDLALVGPGAGPAAAEGNGPVEKLTAAQSSSAGRAVPSVAEAQRLHQLEQAAENAAENEEAAGLYELGLTAEEGGKPNVAKIYYNMALNHATGRLRDQVLARLKGLETSKSP